MQITFNSVSIKLGTFDLISILISLISDNLINLNISAIEQPEVIDCCYDTTSKLQHSNVQQQDANKIAF